MNMESRVGLCLQAKGKDFPIFCNRDIFTSPSVDAREVSFSSINYYMIYGESLCIKHVGTKIQTKSLIH
jgi:hypothetical protein